MLTLSCQILWYLYGPMILSILLVFSRQIGVCVVFGLIVFCVTQSFLINSFLMVIELVLIFFYQFFLFSFQDLFRSFLVLFFCFVLVLLILMLCLGLTYSYALSWSYLFLLLSRCPRRTLLRILSQSTDMFIYSTLRAEPVFTLTESGTLLRSRI